MLFNEPGSLTNKQLVVDVDNLHISGILVEKWANYRG